MMRAALKRGAEAIEGAEWTAGSALTRRGATARTVPVMGMSKRLWVGSLVSMRIKARAWLAAVVPDIRTVNVSDSPGRSVRSRGSISVKPSGSLRKRKVSHHRRYRSRGMCAGGRLCGMRRTPCRSPRRRRRGSGCRSADRPRYAPAAREAAARPTRRPGLTVCAILLRSADPSVGGGWFDLAGCCDVLLVGLTRGGTAPFPGLLAFTRGRRCRNNGFACSALRVRGSSIFPWLRLVSRSPSTKEQCQPVQCSPEGLTATTLRSSIMKARRR